MRDLPQANHNLLKSSLDRFIVLCFKSMTKEEIDLKSSLDRFIVQQKEFYQTESTNLKSSLDRFIAVPVQTFQIPCQFKIQFG